MPEGHPFFRRRSEEGGRRRRRIDTFTKMISIIRILHLQRKRKIAFPVGEC